MFTIQVIESSTGKPAYYKKVSVGFKGKRLIYFSILMFMIVSCGPQSKEAYLKRYDSFISEVDENRSKYSNEDWEKKNKEFQQFSDEWYKKFKGDFTWKEEITLTAHKVKFNYFLISKESSVFFKKLFDDIDVNKIKSQIKFYVDNQMNEDITSLLKEAKKAGNDAEMIVSQILNDLKVNIKTLDSEHDD
jgi:hypothetical protein